MKMRKVLSLILAVTMIFGMMAVSADAATIPYAVDYTDVTGVGHGLVGKLVGLSSSAITKVYNTSSEYLEPGTSVYLILGTTAEYNTSKVTKVGLYPEDTESKKVVTRVSSATIKKNIKIKTSSTDSTYVTFFGVEIPLKEYNVTLNNYNDPVDVDLRIDISQQYSSVYPTGIQFSVCYEDGEGGGEISEATSVFNYESGDEIYIFNEDSSFEFEATATGKGLAKIAMDSDTIEEIEDIYGAYASLTYFNGEGTISKIKNGQITIAAEGSKYLYKYENGTLVDYSKYYNSTNDSFVFKTTGTSYTFGTWVVSDAKLSSAAVSSTTTTTTTTSTQPTTSTTKTTTTTVKPVIPNTGVAFELQ